MFLSVLHAASAAAQVGLWQPQVSDGAVAPLPQPVPDGVAVVAAAGVEQLQARAVVEERAHHLARRVEVAARHDEPLQQRELLDHSLDESAMGHVHPRRDMDAPQVGRPATTPSRSS